MLSDALWRTLRLEPDLLARRSAFFVQYAESVTRTLGPDLEELIRRAEVQDAREVQPVTWIEDLRGAGSEELVDVPDEFPSREPRGFELAIRADALREAALATLTIDIPVALGLLLRSGTDYEAAGVPYGVFLIALANPVSGASTQAAQTLLRAWRPPTAQPPAQSDRPSEERGNEAPKDWLPPILDSATAAARNPTQQLYLALTTRQDPHLDREYGELFGRLAEQPQTKSPIAFGSTGLPLSDWWSLVSDLTWPIDAGIHGRDDIERRLQDFAVEHGHQISRAQNTAQWDDARAAVDIVDLDVAGATCFASRRLQTAGLAPLTEEDFIDAEPLAMVSLSVGIGMANESPMPEEAPS